MDPILAKPKHQRGALLELVRRQFVLATAITAAFREIAEFLLL
jgi:hypothetical protein